MKNIFFFILMVIFQFSGFGQKMNFLPKQNLWQTQSLDPLSSQSGVLIGAYWENDKPADFFLTTFTFGFQKAIFAWPKGEEKGFDLGLEGAALTQFEWTDREGAFQRNILSTDFWIGVPFVMYFKPWTIRIRFYHLSAHMGDDYMIRNDINSYHKNNTNYEQLDVTASYLLKNFRFYFGTGIIVRSSHSRKPLEFTAGMDYLLSLNKKGTANFYAGFYADSKQEYNFTPAINIGAGVQLGNPRRPVKILFTYFNGPLPYSVYEGRTAQWLGAGIYINPF